MNFIILNLVFILIFYYWNKIKKPDFLGFYIYCNNVTLGAECSQSGSHVTIIIQNFTLVSSTSTTTPHWVWRLFGASGPFLDLRTRSLLTLRTRPLTVYAIENGWTSMRNDPLWYYLQIVHLSRHEARSSSDVT